MWPRAKRPGGRRADVGGRSPPGPPLARSISKSQDWGGKRFSATAQVHSKRILPYALARRLRSMKRSWTLADLDIWSLAIRQHGPSKGRQQVEGTETASSNLQPSETLGRPARTPEILDRTSTSCPVQRGLVEGHCFGIFFVLSIKIQPSGTNKHNIFIRGLRRLQLIGKLVANPNRVALWLSSRLKIAVPVASYYEFEDERW